MDWKSLKIKDLYELQIAIHKLEWDELAYDLMKLEEECSTLKEYLKPSEIKQIRKLINLYTIEKQARLEKSRYSFRQEYDPRDAGAGWLEVDVDDLGL